MPKVEKQIANYISMVDNCAGYLWAFARLCGALPPRSQARRNHIRLFFKDVKLQTLKRNEKFPTSVMRNCANNM